MAAARTIKMVFHDLQQSAAGSAPVGPVIIAGWTGRDPAAVEHHIAELAALGVARPAATPIFYRVASSRLTNDDVMEVSGTASSGEVEFVLFQSGGRLWVGVGSDHTDRDFERYSVTVSKQMCDKPIAAAFWLLQDVVGHWDQLILRSTIIEKSGERVLYQEGAVAGMLSPADLLDRWGHPLTEGTVMFCGTLQAHGGVRAAARFEYEIEDPVLQRKITHGYDVVTLPVLG